MKNIASINKTYELYGEVLKSTDFTNSYDKNAYIPYSADFSSLGKSIVVGGKTAPNRIEYQPMEGQDALVSGDPTETTFERYRKLAKGGAGLIWLEAVAVEQCGKSNPYQLELKKENVDLFSCLSDMIKTECMKQNGFEPVIIMQMTHSGRYAKPNGIPEPIAAYYNPDIDKNPPPVATDDFLKGLPDKYITSAKLAKEAGFDGVDIKCCHGYLLSELLSAFDREGIYGGSFENRTRLLRDITSAVDETLPSDFIRSVRLNAFDGYPGKYCFGKPKNEDELYDLTEAEALFTFFTSKRVSLMNVTMGSPYRNPDVSRPYKKGLDKPKSDAISALSRLFSGAAELKASHPNLAVVNTGISLLGRLSPFAAAGLVEENMTDFVGFGRMSFAYPDLARDILNGTFDEKQCCVACSGCSILKKNVLKSGCIIRNDFYKEIYREFAKNGGVSH